MAIYLLGLHVIVAKKNHELHLHMYIGFCRKNIIFKQDIL